MLQSVQLIHFLLMITSARVAADSFFLGEHGGNAEGELSITESHFACDRRPGCMAVKYDKKTKQSQLIQENGGRSIIADKNEIVWKKVRFKSCKEALPSHLNEGEYWIQHMNMEVTVRVRCKREEGKVLAMFDHDSEAKVIVDGFEKPDYYIRVLKYKNKLEDMIAFVNSSIACKQFTRFDCIHMLLEDSYTFLSDRNGKEMLYIGGGPPAGTEEEPGISGEDLYLDKSFFECARQSSCWDVPKKAKEKTTNEVWKKVVYRSCKEAWRPGNLKEETYLIQFEGTSVPVEVRCAQQNGTMVVLFDHDSETRMNVTGFEPPGAYRHIITYKNPLRDVISVVDKLGECRQWTRVDCSGMILISNTGQHFGYIVDRKGDQMKYFGGGNSTGTGIKHN
eukprot:gene7007-12631_t